MRTSRFFKSAVAAAMLSAMTLAATAPVEARHGRNGAAALGVAAGAAIALGALGLAASANAAPPPPGVYDAPPPPPGVYLEPPPPPATVYVPAPVYGESPDEAVQACHEGIETAARQQGAYRVHLNRVMNVRPRGDGHRVRAEMTAYYRGYARTSLVTCETADGYLVSARAS
ncbi:hypothetical protein GCM10007276_09040 [Agaricicola taiwanensis]|uniref:Uncharacterized protein n=1 Tax=Agaricicola taiwanensis TaxID=591372 RepID=A0A8J2VNJ4_9RHOB|nr:hypothetical protein [Agaricicola taiwanensis]GGE33900.1 hypothetical protein GCM10007276_09040 [Agaricicola taiwanensis]